MIQKGYSDTGLFKEIEGLFAVPREEMKRIIRDFHSEMDKGLAGKASSLKMIPTYVDRPTGDEKGRFIALDLGGTNFRILALELKGRGRTSTPIVKKFTLGERCITGTAEEFFGFIASCVGKFIKENELTRKGRLNLGFTFSFPVRQAAVSSGVLLKWTKGFRVKGAVGKDVVRLLETALERKGFAGIKVAALVNDTVGTLIARSYSDMSCDVGVILGTGTNAAYFKEPRAGKTAVNIEWGNFNKLKRTPYDIGLDENSENPGEQVLEKMVSGMYLGEVARLLFNDLAGSGGFKRLKDFNTEEMSLIEAGRSCNIYAPKRLLKKICGIVSTRAARISAAALGAVVTKTDPRLEKRHTVAIDGSLYEKHPGFAGKVKKALYEIFGRRAARINMRLTKDGSGKGAAIVAAIVSNS